MKKKLLLSMVICGMAVSAFTSCGDKTETEEKSVTDTITTTIAETEKSAETEPVELVEPDYPVPVVDPNAITFDDGEDFFTAHCLNGKNFEDGEAECKLSIAEYKGQKMLKVEVLGKNSSGEYGIPKIVFDVDELVGAENQSKIKSFSMDITQVAVGECIGDDGEPLMAPGNLMGAFGSNVGEENKVWYEPTGSCNNFLVSEWNFEWVYLHAEGKWLVKNFVDGTTDSTLIFMRWALPNQADIYMDNLTFYDADGNSIPIVYTPGEKTEEPSEENTSVQE